VEWSERCPDCDVDVRWSANGLYTRFENNLYAEGKGAGQVWRLTDGRVRRIVADGLLELAPLGPDLYAHEIVALDALRGASPVLEYVCRCSGWLSEPEGWAGEPYCPRCAPQPPSGEAER